MQEDLQMLPEQRRNSSYRQSFLCPMRLAGVTRTDQTCKSLEERDIRWSIGEANSSRQQDVIGEKPDQTSRVRERGMTQMRSI